MTNTVRKLRTYNLKPLAPIVALLSMYVLFMPRYPTPFFELVLYQQLIAASALPTIFGSLFWFAKRNELLAYETPEERILDE